MSEKDNYSWKSNPTSRKINTSEFCFLCLKTTQIKIETIDELSGFINNNESIERKVNSPISLLCLRRHLKINNNKISGSGEPSSVPTEEFKVNLCKVCEKIVCKFSVLFQQFEKLGMELDYYVEKIRSCIKEGIENPELVEAYSKEMTSKADTLSQLAWIDKFRKEIAKKCAIVCVASHLDVGIIKSEIQNDSISPFVKEELNSDIQEGGNSENLSPPASPSDSILASNVTQNANSSAQMAIEMDKNTRRFHCPSCTLSFTKKHVAQDHFNVIHLQEKWKCGLCGIEIRAYQVAIRKHKINCCRSLQKRSEDAEARKHFKFPCPICNKRFPNQWRLNTHKRQVHQTSKPFPCTLCGKGFKSARDLKIHSESVHLGVKWKCKPE